MSRYVFLALFAGVLIVPFLLRLVVASDMRTIPEGAAVSPLTLVIVTPHNQDIRREFARGYNEWRVARGLPAVRIDYRNVGGTNDVKRLLESEFRGFLDDQNRLPPDAYVNYDLVWGGGDFMFEQELNRLFTDAQGRRVSVLQPARINRELLLQAFPKQDLAGVNLVEAFDANDPESFPRWIGVCLSSFGIVYSPDLYERLGLPSPTGWSDLARPELADKLALADPTRSGSAGVAYMMVLQRAMQDAIDAHPQLRSVPRSDWAKHPEYRATISKGWKRGMGDLLLIAANARYFTDSANVVPKDVANADAAAGVAIDFYGRVNSEVYGDDRIRFVSPAAATAVNPDPVAILNGVRGEKYDLAVNFIEYLLSPEGQLLWIKQVGVEGGPRTRALRRPPVRADLYHDRTGWTDQVNPFEETGGFNQVAEWMRIYSDIRPIWAAAWIDSRPQLRRAYRAVLNVPDTIERQRLLERLRDLPITLEDVELDNQTRGAMNRDALRRVLAPEVLAERRMTWAQVFRAHYAAVERAAREASRTTPTDAAARLPAP